MSDTKVAVDSASSTSLRALSDHPGFVDRSELTARVVSSKVKLGARVVELWDSRELFVFLVRKELKVKYKGSVLGLLWSMLNPAVTLMVYFVVFKYFLKNDVPDFALYLFSGLIVWNFFLTALLGSSSTIVANAGIVKKVSFPREILALAQVGTSGMFFVFQSIVLVLFLAGFQYSPDWRYMPLVLFGIVDLIVFTSALAIFLSAVNVYMRDIEHLIAVLLNAWFWGVPIIYSFVKIEPHRWLRYFFLADPMTDIILAFQRAIYGKLSYVSSQVFGAATSKLTTVSYPFHFLVARSIYTQQLPAYSYHYFVFLLGCVLVAGIVLLLAAMLVFGRIEGNFAEEL